MYIHRPFPPRCSEIMHPHHKVDVRQNVEYKSLFSKTSEPFSLKYFWNLRCIYHHRPSVSPSCSLLWQDIEAFCGMMISTASYFKWNMCSSPKNFSSLPDTAHTLMFKHVLHNVTYTDENEMNEWHVICIIKIIKIFAELLCFWWSHFGILFHICMQNFPDSTLLLQILFV